MDDAIEGVTGLAKSISEYGPFIVILAMVMVLFIAIILYILKENKKAREEERELSKQLLASVLENIEKKSKETLESNHGKNYDEKNIVAIFTKLNDSLRNVCDLTLKKTQSNRTAIYVFHNGSHASHGLPFFKMTCICEKVTKDSNANILMSAHSAMPLNLFDSIVSSLYNNGEYRITQDTNNPVDIIFLKGSKIQDCFFVPIYDSDDKIMGFIFNGYNTLDPDRDINKEKEFLVELAMMAKPVIEFSKYQEYQSKNNNEEE